MPLPQPIARVVGHRHAALSAALAAIVVALPTLGLGYQVDDHWHRVFVERSGRFAGLARGPLDVFRFYDGTDATSRQLVDAGVAPWWTLPELRLSFMRPLTGLTHGLDYLVFKHPVASHAFSIACYAVAAWLAARLYARLFAAGHAPRAPWVAGFAGLLWALDHNHGLSVGWIAGRNAVLARAFALASVYLALGRRTRDVVLSTLAFGAALAAGEAGLGAFAYLVANEAYLSDDGYARRALRLAPQTALLVGWAALRRGLGYGAHGSGMYTEPLANPVAFASRTLEELPALVGSELGLPGLDAWAVLPRPAQLGMVAFSCAAIALTSALLVPLGRSDRRIRALVVGGVLAAVPACATLPSTRALVLPSFGLLGALALGFEAALTQGGSPLLVRIGGRVVWLLAWAHLALSPLVFQVVALGMTSYEEQARRFADSYPSDATNARVLLFSIPEPTFTGYSLVLRDARGQPGPRAAFTVASGLYPSEVTRAGERTFVVRQPDGFYRRGAMDTLSRDLEHPMSPGDRVALDDLVVEVLEVSAEGIPLAIRLELTAPLDRYRFVWWSGRALAPFDAPAPGETRRIAARSFFEVL